MMSPKGLFTFSRLILSVLLIAVVLSLASFKASAEPELAPTTFSISQVIPFANVATGLRARNRVYRTANSYIAERQQYYNRLREKARQQLLDREILDLKDSQVAAYTRMVALVEQERSAMIQFAESEKRAAREQFLETVETAVVTRLLGSGLAQDLFRALDSGIGSAQDALSNAINQLSGGGGGFLAEVQRVRRVATKINAVSQIIGGRTGENLRQASARIVETIDRPTEEIEAGLNQVQTELSGLQSAVTDLRSLNRDINVSQVTREVALNTVTGEESDDPAINTIIAVLAGKLQREGGTFRERARGALLGSFVARCAAFGERYRNELAVLEYDPDGEPPSDEQVFSPCNAIDLDQLEQEIAAEQADEAEEQEDEAEGEGPNLVFQSMKKTASDCGSLFGGGEGGFCDISTEAVLEYHNFEEPAAVSCTDVFNEPIGEAQITDGSGTIVMAAFYERNNHTLFEGDFTFMRCEAIQNGQTITAANSRASDIEWSE